jgi:phenylpropionate dioxygenase-like ring-hydroxylating dioxygenase large terminal subunit
MRVEDFWYVVAESHELRPGVVLARKVLGEWLAVFRGPDGRPTALQDRCKHRNGRLSSGTVKAGCLACPYHGWTYDAAGQVVAVPAEGASFKATPGRRGQAYATREQDDFVYVRLAAEPAVEVEPFRMPHYREPGYRTVRLQNRMNNNVTNCAENFIDIPHTVFVHPGIFRKPRAQRLTATVTRKDGQVHANYRGETDNLGWFRWFLNPGGREIRHVDSFYMPNVTSVIYEFGPRRVFVITSQSVPAADDDTLVYTDLTFDYGFWNHFAAPIVRWQSQKVIDQDVAALAAQHEVIAKYGESFSNTSADIIHVFVESIREALAKGEDPRALPEREVEVEFLV